METDVAESAFYQYNESNQLVSAKLFDGKKNTTVTYIYDENGNHVFQLNDNLHTDEDWKGNNGNGNRKTVSPGRATSISTIRQGTWRGSRTRTGICGSPTGMMLSATQASEARSMTWKAG